jgi:hypothetical protein
MSKTLNELWYDVTGLVWDIDTMIKNKEISKEQAVWYIPDGAILAPDADNRRKTDTAALLEMLGLDSARRFSEVDVTTYDNEENWDDQGSN